MEIGLLKLPRPCPLARMRFRVCCGDLPGLMAPRDAWAQLCSSKMCGGGGGVASVISFGFRPELVSFARRWCLLISWDDY